VRGPVRTIDGGFGLAVAMEVPGLPWLHNAKSGLICGVGQDAAYIAQPSRAIPGHRWSNPSPTHRRPAGSLTICAVPDSIAYPACSPDTTTSTR